MKKWKRSLCVALGLQMAVVTVFVTSMIAAPKTAEARCYRTRYRYCYYRYGRRYCRYRYRTRCTSTRRRCYWRTRTVRRRYCRYRYGRRYCYWRTVRRRSRICR